jgi:hypothetical protein
MAVFRPLRLRRFREREEFESTESMRDSKGAMKEWRHSPEKDEWENVVARSRRRRSNLCQYRADNVRSIPMKCFRLRREFDNL